jgi:hypothetical protein
MPTGRSFPRSGSHLLIILLLITSLVFMGCPSPEPPPPKPQPKPGGHVSGDQLKPATKRPDLTVASIQVYNNPQKPRHFTFTVDVTNLGDAPSGEYDVAMYIKEMATGSIYPVGTFRQKPMNPGEKYCVYQELDRMVNNTGPHQLHVEIKPFMFEDRNPQNNIMIKPFNVN